MSLQRLPSSVLCSQYMCVHEVQQQGCAIQHRPSDKQSAPVYLSEWIQVSPQTYRSHHHAVNLHEAHAESRMARRPPACMVEGESKQVPFSPDIRAFCKRMFCSCRNAAVLHQIARRAQAHSCPAAQLSAPVPPFEPTPPHVCLAVDRSRALRGCAAAWPSVTAGHLAYLDSLCVRVQVRPERRL